MEKDSKRVRASRELKDLKDRSFDELVAHSGSIARGYDWLSKTIICKFVQSFVKDKDQCNVEEDIEEEQEEDIVEEEKSRNELEAKTNETKNKKRKRSLVRKQVVELYPKRDLPVEFRKIIQKLQGCDEVLVMDKLLTMSDVTTGLGRLSIPQGQIKNKFLTEQEEKDMEEKEKAIQVRLIEPCLAVSKLYFKRWQMTKSCIYVLLSCWQKVVHNPDNGLVVVKEKKTVRVQLWAFRAGSKRELCFALVNVGPVLLCQARDGDGDEDGDGVGSRSSLAIAGDDQIHHDNGATTSSSSKEKQDNGDDGTSSSQHNGDLAYTSGDSATIVQPQQQCSD